MNHMVTYRAIDGTYSTEFTVITECPMHMSRGVKKFLRETAKKHGFKEAATDKCLFRMNIHRIVILLVSELDNNDY